MLLRRLAEGSPFDGSSAVCAVRPFELVGMHDGSVCVGVWGRRYCTGVGRSRVKKQNEPIYGRDCGGWMVGEIGEVVILPRFCLDFAEIEVDLPFRCLG